MMERLGQLEQQHRHTMEALFQMKENVSDCFNAYTEQAGACLWSAYKPKVHFLTLPYIWLKINAHIIKYLKMI